MRQFKAGDRVVGKADAPEAFAVLRGKEAVVREAPKLTTVMRVSLLDGRVKTRTDVTVPKVIFKLKAGE